MRLSRRDMLTTLLGAPLAATLAACDDPEPTPIAGASLDPNLALGHRLRSPSPSDEEFSRAARTHADVAIVGAGPSGLAAARQLRRRGVAHVRVLELESKPGGTSLAGQTAISAHPWGAHYITRPLPHNGPLLQLLEEMNLFDDSGEVREQYLVTEPKERLYYRGFYYQGLYPTVGASKRDLLEWNRFQAQMVAFARRRGSDGKPAFAIPVSMSSADPEFTALDRLSAADWLRRQGYRSSRLRFMVDYACRDDYGLMAEHTSAWALVLYYAARIDPGTGTGTEVITWPEGNGALVNHLARSAGATVQTGQLVVDVVSKPGGVHLHVVDGSTDRLHVIEAKRAILATPQFISRRIVRGLRDGEGLGRSAMRYGAWMVANLHLKTRPPSHGCEPAWDSVLFDSPSLGYVSATHQRGRSRGPGLWTYYLPMTDGDPAAGRTRLFQATHGDLVDAVLRDLGRAHRGLRNHVTRIDTRRWGHGMVQPAVDSVWHNGRNRVGRPLDHVHFAHSDLSGIALFEEAFDQGYRAANAVADELQS